MAPSKGSGLEIRAVRPTEALDYFRGKGLQESFAWQDLWHEDHARAFTVAKSAGTGILEDVRAALDQAIAEGQNIEQFRTALRPTLEAKGWWGKARQVDPLTGEERLVQLGSPRRLRTIFDVNMRTAHMAGHWARIQRTKASFPYLRYVAVQDARTRPQHMEWHGTIRPVDDPWWDAHYPPCGWNCRCTVMQVSERMLAQRGWSVTERPTAFPPRAYVNPRTGEVSTVEGGIDPGFAYNVGRAYLARETPSPIGGGPPPAPPAMVDRSAAPIPARPGPPLLPRAAPAEAAIDAFLADFGASRAAAADFADVVGQRFVAGAGLFRQASGRPVRLTPGQIRALRLVGAAIRDPAEVRQVWIAGPPRKDGGPVPTRLGRRYLARFETGEGVVGAAVDVSAGGGAPSWQFAVSLDEGFALERLRSGDLIWRRGDLTTPGFEAFVRTWSSTVREMEAKGDGPDAIRAAVPNDPVQPVGVLRGELARLLGADEGAEVLVSPWSVGHGSAKDMAPADWAKLQGVLDEGEARVDERGWLFGYRRDAGRVLELLASPEADGRWLVRTFYGWTRRGKLAGKRAKSRLLRPGDVGG